MTRAQECRLRPGDAPRAEGRDPAHASTRALDLVQLASARRQAAGPALRRPAAARRHRARDRHRAAARADGRAAVQPRRQAAARDAHRDPAHPPASSARTTIYVTHDQDEALSLADRIVVLHEGKVQQIGTPEELYARPANLDVARFMGYRNLLDARRRAASTATRVDAARRRDRACAAPRSRRSRRAPVAVAAVRPDGSSTPGGGGANAIAGHASRSSSICGRDWLVEPCVAAPTAADRSAARGARTSWRRGTSARLRGRRPERVARLSRPPMTRATTRRGLRHRLPTRRRPDRRSSSVPGAARRAAALRLPVPLRARRCRSRRRRAACSPTTAASSRPPYL